MRFRDPAMNPPPSRLWQRGIQTTPGSRLRRATLLYKEEGALTRVSNVNRGYTAQITTLLGGLFLVDHPPGRQPGGSRFSYVNSLQADTKPQLRCFIRKACRGRLLGRATSTAATPLSPKSQHCWGEGFF